MLVLGVLVGQDNVHRVGEWVALFQFHGYAGISINSDEANLFVREDQNATGPLMLN